LNMKDWTIDTSILAKSADGNNRANEFLQGVFNRAERISYNKHVTEEYEDFLKTAKEEGRVGISFVEQWYFQAASKKLFIQRSAKLEINHKRNLNKLKFKNDDIPFVGVCFNSEFKKLVTEDNKGYKPQVISYLKSPPMTIDVLSIKQALSI
jgi:hypothetical protein